MGPGELQVTKRSSVLATATRDPGGVNGLRVKQAG